MDAPAVHAVGLSKRFGDTAALTDLDLDISPCEVVGHRGPNGAGKTSTLRLLLGPIRPSAGRAAILGLDCWQPAVQAHRHLGYVVRQVRPVAPPHRSRDTAPPGRLQGRVDPACRDTLVERSALGPSRKVHTYSRGNREKIALIAALMGRPDLPLLDEPTSGLDPLMEQVLRTEVPKA